MSKPPKNFCVLILTHGRPNNQYTLETLKRLGYTGRVYLVVDDEDPTLLQYKQTYGNENILVFNKASQEHLFDKYDNRSERRAIIWARNACWELARKTGHRYFIQLDDDYTNISHRRQCKSGYRCLTTHNLNEVFAALVEFLKNTPQANTICISQGGDHIGGENNKNATRSTLLRKAMNSFVCDTQRPFYFNGRINEDVNTYVAQGHTGLLLLTYTRLQLTQQPTQSNAGGMTEAYLAGGSYIKSFYTIIAAPHCTTIVPMGNINMRLHHQINWRHAVPKILAETHKQKVYA